MLCKDGGLDEKSGSTVADKSDSVSMMFDYFWSAIVQYVTMTNRTRRELPFYKLHSARTIFFQFAVYKRKCETTQYLNFTGRSSKSHNWYPHFKRITKENIERQGA